MCHIKGNLKFKSYTNLEISQVENEINLKNYIEVDSLRKIIKDLYKKTEWY